MISGATLKESLFENIKIISEDYLEIMFKTKFEGSVLTEFSEKLRAGPELKFTEEDTFKRDVQVVFNENYVNEYFLHLFHSKEMISLTEVMMAAIPEEHEDGWIGNTIKSVL